MKGEDRVKNKKYFCEGRELDIGQLLNKVGGESRVSRIQKTVKMLEGGEKALDIGCYTGYMTVMIGEKYKKVIGIDMLPHNIDIARELFARPNIEYLVMDASDIAANFEGETFDCIVLAEVLEHITCPHLLIQNCYGLLKTGGIIIVSTPNAFSLKAFADYFTVRNLTRAIKRLENSEMGVGTQVDHIFNWDAFTLARLFIMSGFKIRELDFAGAYLPDIIRVVVKRLLRRGFAEPGYLLPLLGRFAYQIIFKFSKL